MFGNEQRTFRVDQSHMASMSVPLPGTEAVRGGDVPASADELERSIMRLGNAIDVLISRLDPLLSDANKTANEVAPVPPRGACQLSAAIWEAGARIDAQMLRVHDAADRLEV